MKKKLFVIALIVTSNYAGAHGVKVSTLIGWVGRAVVATAQALS